MKAWHNGTDVHPAKVPTLDAPNKGFFETLRTLDGKPLHWPLHERRIDEALRHFGWQHHDTIRDAVDHLAGPNRRIRVQVTEEDVWAIARLFVPYRGDPVRVSLSPVQLPGGPVAGHKPLPFHPYLEAASAIELDDALITDGTNVVEATTSNVVARIGDDVISPGREQGAVDGVTRRRLLPEIRGVPLPISRLEEVDEMVLMNTRGVRAVGELNGRALQPGPWSRGFR